MIKIAICDDDERVCSHLEEMVYQYAQLNKYEIELDIFMTAKELSKKINETEGFDIIFLDIEVGDESGIDIGKSLREDKGDEITKIIFISNMDSYAMELFRIRPLDFLKKPLKMEDITYNLDKAIGLLQDQNQLFFYKVRHKIYKIQMDKIIYFESVNRVVVAYTTEGKIEFYDKLAAVEQRLDRKYFWRIHQSYIIHSLHSANFDHKEVSMTNKVTLPISQSYRLELKKQQRALMREGR